MEPSINKIMKSNNIAAAAKRYGLSDDEMWNLYYESGIVFLNYLKIRIKHKREFDRVFKPFLSQIGGMSLPSVFKMIEYSPAYWKWWANHLWCVCFNCPASIKDTANSLIYDNITLPNFTLKNIIDGSKYKQISRQSNYSAPAREIDSTQRKKAEA